MYRILQLEDQYIANWMIISNITPLVKRNGKHYAQAWISVGVVGSRIKDSSRSLSNECKCNRRKTIPDCTSLYSANNFITDVM